jgi:RND superfamily putative drug exporter
MEVLARALVRWRWVVVAVWALVGVWSALRAPETLEKLDVAGGGREITEAVRAEAMLAERFAKPISDFLVLVVTAPQPFDTLAGTPVLDSLNAAIAREPYVRSVVTWRGTKDSTFVSRDLRRTFFVVSVDAGPTREVGPLVKPLRDAASAVLARLPEAKGHATVVTGRAALDRDVREVSAEDSARAEKGVFPLTLVVLMLAFGALVAAILPLIIGFLAIWISLTIVGLLADVTPMSIFVLNMTTMIGLGVGIDYSLLIVTRFREELARGLRRTDAAVRTTIHAGHAVMVSGLTVFVGFGALLLTPLIETRSVGIGGLLVVAVAVLLSVTLMPAMLAILGKGIDRPKWLARKLAWYHSPLMWEKWARSLSRHPRRALVLGGSFILVLTLPVFWIKVGLPARNWWPTRTEAGVGLKQLEEMGVAGYVNPVRMLVTLPEGSLATETASLRGLRSLSDSLRADPRVREVRSLVDVGGRPSLLSLSLQYSDLDSARAQQPDLLDAYLSRDGRTTLLDIIPRDTVTLTTQMDLVRKVRALVQTPPKQLKAATFATGGYVASSVDFQDDLLRRFPLIVGLVLGVTAIMLAIAFRSVLIPLKAIVLNSLSVSATFGLVVLVFQMGFGASLINLDGSTEAIFVAVPVLVFAVVFGLSMDYEVFLLSRMKEAFDRTGDNRAATMEGVSATASVITSAALIMLIVFGAFAYARLLMVQFLGFGLAMAVLLDATVIRMVLVPAFMQVAGDWNWWPGTKPKPKAIAPDAGQGPGGSA